jgi:hypothetical protein
MLVSEYLAVFALNSGKQGGTGHSVGHWPRLVGKEQGELNNLARWLLQCWSLFGQVVRLVQQAAIVLHPTQFCHCPNE